jgi:type II secretory pathway pseudopilin PulG
MRSTVTTGRAGFTLIETVVILTMLGIVAAVTVPSLARTLRDGADATTRDIVSLLGTAREAAATRGVQTSAAIELATGAYWVVTRPAGTGAADTIRQGRFGLPPAIRLSGGDQGWVVTVFDPLGRSRGGTLFVSEGQHVRAITTDPWTGSIDVVRH